MRRWLRLLVVFLAAGAVATVLIAWASALLVDLTGARSISAEQRDGDVQWRVDVARTATGMRVTSTRQRGLGWSPSQAAGAPDTPQMGDIVTAWASYTPDTQDEWLELDYDPPVRPVAIHVYESYNPGAVVRATIYDDQDGTPSVVWSGAAAGMTPATAPTATRSGGGRTMARILKLASDKAVATRRLRLDLDSKAVPGWNEIDAVGLQRADGTVQWAKRVRASSTYAAASAGSVQPVEPLLPRWAPAREPAPAFAYEQVKTDHRVIDGRGWPAVALVADVTAREASAVLPFRPFPPGFAIDCVVFALGSVLLWWLATWPKKFIAESMRLRRGRCMRCGYELQYNFAAGCPECGWRRASS